MVEDQNYQKTKHMESNTKNNNSTNKILFDNDLK